MIFDSECQIKSLCFIDVARVSGEQEDFMHLSENNIKFN